jgi:chromosome segregation ATPase
MNKIKIILVALVISCASTGKTDYKLSEAQEKFFDVKDTKVLVKESKTISEVEKEKINNSLEKCEIGRDSLLTEINKLRKENSDLKTENTGLREDNSKLNKELNETKEDAGRFYGIQYVVGTIITFIILGLIFWIIKKFNLKIPFIG